MAVRSDVTVDWQSSPRIITIGSPSVEITIQDLVDTSRELEDDFDGLDNPHLVNAAGKEDLGGGVNVGITASLQNARVAFEARDGPDYVQCNIAGGNLVAVNSGGTTMNPIEPTSYTQVIKTSSSSATLSNLEIENLQRIIESNRQSHGGFGDVWYLNPVDGNDGNAGTSSTNPFKTFSKAHDTATANDIIFLLPKATGSETHLQERMVITKNNLSVRGPGVFFHIHPSGNNPGHVVDVQAQGVSLHGVSIYSDATSGHAINMVGDYNRFDNIIIGSVVGDGFYSENCSNTMINTMKIYKTGGYGIHIVNCEHLGINNVEVDNPGSSLCINISGTSTETDINNCLCENTTNGIEVGTSANTIKIRDNNRFLNVTNPIIDSGTNTHDEWTSRQNDLSNTVWKQSISGNATTGTYGGQLNKSLTTAKFIALK